MTESCALSTLEHAKRRGKGKGTPAIITPSFPLFTLLSKSSNGKEKLAAAGWKLPLQGAGLVDVFTRVRVLRARARDERRSPDPAAAAGCGTEGARQGLRERGRG